MCELFGLSANCVVSVSFSWRGFLRRGEFNYHGWGVGWYFDGGVCLVKEPRPAPESPVARLLLNGVRSHIVVSHVRLASTGRPCYVNTHPFVRRLGGREWILAHNGDVSGIIDEWGFRLEDYVPVGDTDSEYAFCYIMERLSRLGCVGSVIRSSRVIWDLAKRIGGYGKFNFLLSDGRYVFAFMNRSSTLHYLLRHPPHRGCARLVDEDFEVRLSEMKGSSEYAAIIATRPLTDEDWRPFKRNTLYVFGSGDVILRVNANGRLEHTLDRVEVEVLRYIRTSRHSVRLKEVSDGLGLDVGEAYKIIEKLVATGFLKQHSGDRVPPDHPEARYFTNRDRREVIDTLIIKRRS